MPSAQLCRSRRRCSCRSCTALVLCLLVCACALVRLVPWRHEQRIYIAHSLLPGGSSSMPLGDCPSTRFGMLQLFTSWLVKRNVPYFLTYGTLLGAIREGSVISYTPDIDIAIPALWTDRVQKLLQNELPACFETGLGGVNGQVFHLYTRSPTPERLQAASPLLPFLRAEPYLDIYCVLLCHNGRAMEDGAPYSSQGKPTPCDDIIEAGGKQVQYAYIAGLNAAARKSREASADATGIGEHVALLQTQDIFPLNVTGAMIDGVPFSAPHRPYELLEVVYGPDWRVPRDYS